MQTTHDVTSAAGAAMSVKPISSCAKNMEIPRRTFPGGHTGGGGGHARRAASEPGGQLASAEIPASRLALLEVLGRAVGRIELAYWGGEHFQIAGTAWLIGPDLAVTSRHVVVDRLSGFSLGLGQRPPFVTSIFGERPEVAINFGEETVPVSRIEWIEPVDSQADSPDIAFLRLARSAAAAPLEIGCLCEDQNVVVIQYPLYADTQNGDPPLESPGEEYLSAGKVVGFESRKGTLDHTATTFGGSSGSPLIDWESLAVVGMHSGANPGLTGRAVTASVIRDRLDILRSTAQRPAA